MQHYLANGYYLWTGDLDQMDEVGLELVNVDELPDLVFSRLDAKAAKLGKPAASKCNPKPVKNSKGIIVRPATFPCGSVCRQKQNCGLSKAEKQRVQSRLKGEDDRAVKLAMVRAARAKRQGQSGTGAVYAATKEALGAAGQARNEKRKARGGKPRAVSSASGAEPVDMIELGIHLKSSGVRRKGSKVEAAALLLRPLREAAARQEMDVREMQEGVVQIAKTLGIATTVKGKNGKDRANPQFTQFTESLAQSLVTINTPKDQQRTAAKARESEELRQRQKARRSKAVGGVAPAPTSSTQEPSPAPKPQPPSDPNQSGAAVPHGSPNRKGIRPAQYQDGAAIIDGIQDALPKGYQDKMDPSAAGLIDDTIKDPDLQRRYSLGMMPAGMADLGGSLLLWSMGVPEPQNKNSGDYQQHRAAGTILAARTNVAIDRFNGHPLATLPYTEVPPKIETYEEAMETQSARQRAAKLAVDLLGHGQALSSDKDGYTVRLPDGTTKRFPGIESAQRYASDLTRGFSDPENARKIAKDLKLDEQPLSEIPLNAEEFLKARAAVGQRIKDIESSMPRDRVASPKTHDEMTRLNDRMRSPEEKFFENVADVMIGDNGEVTHVAYRPGAGTEGIGGHGTWVDVSKARDLAQKEFANQSKSRFKPAIGDVVTIGGKEYQAWNTPLGTDDEFYDESTDRYYRKPLAPKDDRQGDIFTFGRQQEANRQREAQERAERDRESALQQKKGTPSYVVGVMEDQRRLEEELGMMDTKGFKKTKVQVRDRDGISEVEGLSVPGTSEFFIVSKGGKAVIHHGPSKVQISHPFPADVAKRMAKILVQNGVTVNGDDLMADEDWKTKHPQAAEVFRAMADYGFMGRRALTPIKPTPKAIGSGGAPKAPAPGSPAYDRLVATVREEQDAAWAKRNAKEHSGPMAATKMQKELYHSSGENVVKRTARSAGDGFTKTQQQYIAQSVLDQIPATELQALISVFTDKKSGERRFQDVADDSGHAVEISIPGAGRYKIPLNGLPSFLKGAGIDLAKLDDLMAGVKFDSARTNLRQKLFRELIARNTADSKFPDLYRTDSKLARQSAAVALAVRYQALAWVDRAWRGDSCRISCGECLRKHLGSAIVCAHEVENGYPHHDLLVIGHLSEAEQESARENPDLAEGIRRLRRRFQQGYGLRFEDVTSLLEEMLEFPHTARADAEDGPQTFIPPKAVQENARLGLEMRRSQPESNRCCLPVGLARARDLSNGRPLSLKTIQRMANFDRHRRNYKPGHPTKGTQAWLLWGGTEGIEWAKGILAQMG